MQPLFVIARAALDALDHPAVAGRQHPVAQTGDLGEIAGGNERTSAFARRSAGSTRESEPWQPTSTPCVGSSSSSTPTSRASHLARITFCWLPPDSADAASEASRGRISSASISSADQPITGAAIEVTGARQTIEARQQDVVAH